MPPWCWLADAAQILIFPLFAEGAISPLDDILDLTVMVALIRLIGWHWEFLPSFIAELVPGLDLVPSGTCGCQRIPENGSKLRTQCA